jgi:hypothetical protein
MLPAMLRNIRLGIPNTTMPAMRRIIHVPLILRRPVVVVLLGIEVILGFIVMRVPCSAGDRFTMLRRESFVASESGNTGVRDE